MEGLSIAESQNRKPGEDGTEVDKRIDAKMPKPELGANVRSRKTSHYLGLFKNEEPEEQDESLAVRPTVATRNSEGRSDRPSSMLIVISVQSFANISP